jgi:branched-chain amino acid aminotransferase
LFVVRNGKVITPPLSAGALEGITQWSVIKILEDMGYTVEKGNIARSDLYIADEIFCVGTAAEVSAINSVDDRSVPCPGPITLKVADTYGKAVRGQIADYKHWCELA